MLHRTKAKKYGARILEVIAKVVQDFFQANGESMRENEGSTVPVPKRQREAAVDDGWNEEELLMAAMDDDFMQDTSVPVRPIKRYKPPKS
jgi:hypothetical protein